MAENHNRKMAETAYYQLKDVFLYLLKDGEKLKAFQHNPLICEKEQNEILNADLTQAYFTHCLKELYRKFVTEILVSCSKDDLEYFRKLALDMLSHLLSKKCELDDVILGILINKLGDLSKKVQ